MWTKEASKPTTAAVYDDHGEDKFVKMPDHIFRAEGGNNNSNGWIPYESESDDDKNPQTQDISKTTMKDNDVGLTWKGHIVGHAAKEMFEAVEHRYPDTFKLQIGSTDYWLSILEGLHLFIERFLITSVDALTEDHITSLQDELDDFEKFGFGLSWARERLEMVKNLKYGNHPLRLELVALEESVKALREECVEADEKLEKVKLRYDTTRDALNTNTDEDLLTSNLGLGMLPGYY